MFVLFCLSLLFFSMFSVVCAHLARFLRLRKHQHKPWKAQTDCRRKRESP